MTQQPILNFNNELLIEWVYSYDKYCDEHISLLYLPL